MTILNRRASTAADIRVDGPAAPDSSPTEEPSRFADLVARLRAYRLAQRRKAAGQGRSGGRRTTWVLTGFVGLLLVLFAGGLAYSTPSGGGRQVSLDQFIALTAQHRVAVATFLDQDNRMVGRYVAATSPIAPGDVTTLLPPAGEFWLTYPKSDVAFGSLADRLTADGARVHVDAQSRKVLVHTVTIYLLPLLVLAAVFGLLFAGSKGSGSGLGEVINFGNIGGKRGKEKSTSLTTFKDIGSAAEAVTELQEVVDYLKNPARYQQVGATPPKGVLLFGPPGCGKTLLAKAVAGEAGVPFFAVAGAEFVESLVGVGAARVRDLFARVRAVAPAIVFIDELDAAGRRRGRGGGEGGSDEREQTLNQMLVEMDGFEVSGGIVVMGATNRPDILDPALLRPGRFDRHITIESPDAPGREEILRLHARTRPISPDVDFSYLARRTAGFSGADLANVINEATLLTLRLGEQQVTIPELEEAIQRVLHGPQRRGVVLTQEERERIAVHEAAHAIAAGAVGQAESIHRISILTRGRNSGSTRIGGGADVIVRTADQLYGDLVTTLAGRAAENLVLGSLSTGADDDLETATALAADIVGRHGMNARLGPRRLLANDVDTFLGASSALADLSPAAHDAYDEELLALLTAADADATRLLVRNRDLLDRLAADLATAETLEGPALELYLYAVDYQPPALPGTSPAKPGRGNGDTRLARRTSAPRTQTASRCRPPACGGAPRPSSRSLSRRPSGSRRTPPPGPPPRTPGSARSPRPRRAGARSSCPAGQRSLVPSSPARPARPGTPQIRPAGPAAPI
jgi:cell division protease FtsH